jgi:pentatricopeptide repeat protein
VSRFTDFIESKEHLNDLDKSLTAAKESTVDAYCEEIAISNDRVTRLKLEKELKWANYSSYFPEWLKFLTEVLTTVAKYGYSSHTRWRSAINQLLRHSARSFAKRNGAGHQVTGDFRRMAVAFNAYSGAELEKEISSLVDRAGDVEGMNDPTFQLLRLEFRMAEDAYKRASEAKAYRADKVVEENEKKVKLREEAVRHREDLGLQHHNTTIMSGTMNATMNTAMATTRGSMSSTMNSTGGMNTTRNKSLRLAKMEPSQYTQEGLTLAKRLPVTRENENEMLAKYNKLLAHSANTGDWFGAVAAYEDFVKRGFVPTRFVFQCIISACKRADPPQVDRAILVLDEMRASQIAPNTAAYNAVLDCCRNGGAWRRGVHVFENMMKQPDIKPNTNTYSVLAKMGFEAKNDDPGEIYQTLKFAGVPEYIAYSAAASNALKVDRNKEASGLSLERELAGLKFRELPYVDEEEERVRLAGTRQEKEMAWEIEKAVERILEYGNKGLAPGEDDRTFSTMAMTAGGFPNDDEEEIV